MHVRFGTASGAAAIALPFLTYQLWASVPHNVAIALPGGAKIAMIALLSFLTIASVASIVAAVASFVIGDDH